MADPITINTSDGEQFTFTGDISHFTTIKDMVEDSGARVITIPLPLVVLEKLDNPSTISKEYRQQPSHVALINAADYLGNPELVSWIATTHIIPTIQKLLADNDNRLTQELYDYLEEKDDFLPEERQEYEKVVEELLSVV